MVFTGMVCLLEAENSVFLRRIPDGVCSRQGFKTGEEGDNFCVVFLCRICYHVICNNIYMKNVKSFGVWRHFINCYKFGLVYFENQEIKQICYKLISTLLF